MTDPQLAPWLQPIQWSSLPEQDPTPAGGLTLTDAAVQLGVCPRTLRKLLTVEGKCIHELRKGSAIVLARNLIDALEIKIKGSVPFSRVPELLGVGVKPAKSLRDQNLLPVWIRGGHNGIKHRYMCIREEIEEWVTSLIKHPKTVPTVPDNCVTIAKAIRKQVPISAIVAAIQSGEINVVAVLSGKSRFGGAIIPVTELIAARPPELQRAFRRRRVVPRKSFKRMIYSEVARAKRGGPKRPPPHTIVATLRRAEGMAAQGILVRDAIRSLGLSSTTFYRWRKEFGRDAGSRQSINGPWTSEPAPQVAIDPVHSLSKDRPPQL